MHDIVVIGCGNPLRGDDGLGWSAVDRLQNTLDRDRISFFKCRELGPELSKSLCTASRAMFIDVSVSDMSPKVGEEELFTVSNASLDAHSLDPQSLLSLSEALYGSAPHAVLLTVKGKSFGYEEHLSDELAASLEELVERARSILQEWIVETDRERLIAEIDD